MNNKTIYVILAVAIAMTLVTASIPTPAFSQAENGQSKTLRIGYFPNINHAQAVIGLGRGDFQKALGDNVEVKTQIFNAGPARYRGTICESNRCYIHRAWTSHKWICENLVEKL